MNPERGEVNKMTDENKPNDKGPEGGTETVDTLTAKVEHWKEMARKNEDRAKANAAAATELETLKNAGKSEAEKAVERATAAEAELAKVPTKIADSLRDTLVSLGVVAEADKVLLTASEPEDLIAQVKRLSEMAGKADGNKGNRAPLQGRTADTKSDDNPLRGLARGLFPARD